MLQAICTHSLDAALCYYTAHRVGKIDLVLTFHKILLMQTITMKGTVLCGRLSAVHKPQTDQRHGGTW